MNKRDLTKHREELLAQRNELLMDLRRHQAIPGERIDREDRDPADQANTAVARNLNERIATSEDNLLAKIESALQRVEDGTFGICTQCGNDIPEIRLQAKPSVSLCVSCQTLKEESM